MKALSRKQKKYLIDNSKSIKMRYILWTGQIIWYRWHSARKTMLGIGLDICGNILTNAEHIDALERVRGMEKLETFYNNNEVVLRECF